MSSPPRVMRLVESPDSTRLLDAILAGGIAWLFLGFGVSWLVTGRTTMEGGISDAGIAVWFGPFGLSIVVMLIGPRGHLRALWRPGATVVLDARGITVERPGRPARTISWEDVNGISTESRGRPTVVYDREWVAIEKFERAFGGGWLGSVPGWMAADLRPDRFVRVGNRWTQRYGGVRRGLGGFPPIS